MRVRQAAGVAPESRSGSRWEFESSTEVRTVVGGSERTDPRSPEACQAKLVGTHQVDRRKVQEYAGCPQKDHRRLSVDRRKLAGNSPEEAIDASEQSCRSCLRVNRS